MNAPERFPPQAPGYHGPTYHGQPMLKASGYGWHIWGYTWLAGIAGTAQLLATVADLIGRAELRGMVRQGRALAAFLPVLGTGLLVADLHTPQRFYNMLRIWRGTSPMSIGSWVLSGFGGASLLTWLAARTGRPRLAKVTQLPAAAAGAGMAVYTASLLSATSTPAWSATPRLLAARFAASAFATGAAALSIGEVLRGQPRNAAHLQRVAVLAAAMEYGLEQAADRRLRALGIDHVLHAPDIAARRRGAQLAGVFVPLACVLANELAPRRSPVLALAAAVGMLAGGALMRSAVFAAGNRSAERPQDAFALASGPVRERAP